MAYFAARWKPALFAAIVVAAIGGIFWRFGSAFEARPWLVFWIGALALTGLFLMAALAIAQRDPRRGPRTTVQNAFVASALLIAIGAGFFGISVDPTLISAHSTASATTVALGFLAVGIVVGFLFGLPKVTDTTVQVASGRGVISTSTSTAATTAGAGADTTRLRPNTNLEKVSDWLTTVITGLALSQIGNAPGYVGKLATFLSGGLAPAGSGGAAVSVTALGMIMIFPLTGFLVGYITTRLILTRAFDAADRSLFTVEEKEKVNFPPGLLEKAVGLFGANTPSQGDRETAELIVAATNPTSLMTSDEKATYARAQAVLGHYVLAIPWYQAALALDQRNALLYEQYAAAFYAADDQDAFQLIPPLMKALELSARDPVASARIETNLVLGYLYVEPDGYIRSIQRANRLAENNSLDKVPTFYFYRACAYGELYHAVRSGRSFAPNEVPTTKLDEIAERIMSDTRTALAMQPSLARDFKAVSLPNQDPVENDLRDFADQCSAYLVLLESYTASGNDMRTP